MEAPKGFIVITNDSDRSKILNINHIVGFAKATSGKSSFIWLSDKERPLLVKESVEEVIELINKAQQ